MLVKFPNGKRYKSLVLLSLICSELGQALDKRGVIVNNKSIEDLSMQSKYYTQSTVLYEADKKLKSSNNSTVTTFIISSYHAT